MGNIKLISELKTQERSIAWLARKCKISRAYMHKMIYGKRNFSPKYKNICAEALKSESLFNDWQMDSTKKITWVHRNESYLVSKIT